MEEDGRKAAWVAITDLNDYADRKKVRGLLKELSNRSRLQEVALGSDSLNRTRSGILLKMERRTYPNHLAGERMITMASLSTMWRPRTALAPRENINRAAGKILYLFQIQETGRGGYSVATGAPDSAHSEDDPRRPD
jgi:hypothetical protein